MQVGLLILLVAADQLTKWWIAQQSLSLHITVIDGFFNIVHARNYGVAFSMFADWDHQWRTGMLIGITTGIAIAVAAWWWHERRRAGPESWLLVMILAGAIGNIWDRLQLGYVVDFVQWYVVIGGQGYYWPAFNIADSCISVAVVLLVFFSFCKQD
jgi:signal peptidase II